MTPYNFFLVEKLKNTKASIPSFWIEEQEEKEEQDNSQEKERLEVMESMQRGSLIDLKEVIEEEKLRKKQKREDERRKHYVREKVTRTNPYLSRESKTISVMMKIFPVNFKNKNIILFFCEKSMSNLDPNSG